MPNIPINLTFSIGKQLSHDNPRDPVTDEWVGSLAHRYAEKSFVVTLTGVSHPNDDGSSRQELLAKCKPRDLLTLVPDSNNPYHDKAIKVVTAADQQIGYLDRRCADETTNAMRDGSQFVAAIVGIGKPNESAFLGASIAIFRLNEGVSEKEFRISAAVAHQPITGPRFAGTQPKGRLSPRSVEAFMADDTFDRWAISVGDKNADRWLDTSLVGTGGTNDDGKLRRNLIMDCKPRDPVVLLATPFDTEDQTAVLVCNMEGKWLGYLHRSLARKVARSLNAGTQWLAVVRHILFYELEGDSYEIGLNIVIFQLSAEFAEKSEMREGDEAQRRTRNLSSLVDEEDWD